MAAIRLDRRFYNWVSIGPNDGTGMLIRANKKNVRPFQKREPRQLPNDRRANIRESLGKIRWASAG